MIVPGPVSQATEASAPSNQSARSIADGEAPMGMRVKLSKVGPFFGKVWAFSLVVAAVAQESFVKAVGLFDAGG